MPRGPTTPELAPHAPAPRHGAHQRPSAAGVCPGRTQAEAFAVLAHLQQTHPFQEMKVGGRTSACGREEDLFVPFVLSPRTVYWTQRSSLGLNKEEKDLDSPSVSQMQLPAWR